MAALATGTVLLASGTEDTATSLTAAGATSSWSASSGPVALATESTATVVDADAVLAQVDAAASAAGGSISVVVLDSAGQELLAGDASVTYTASLVKLFVVTRLLQLDEAGSLSLSADDLALMQAAVSRSDDGAMSTLWVRYDGDQLVTDIADELGLTGTAAPIVTGQWGQTTTTAADLATFLASMDDVLDSADRGMVLGWMQSATATAADGFDQAFGLFSEAVDADGSVAVKQGWMCCVDDQRQLHSIGVLADGTVVVLLGNFPESTSWDEARTALDTAATAVVTAVG